MTDTLLKSAVQRVLDKPHPLATARGQALVERWAKKVREKVLSMWGADEQRTDDDD